MNGKAYAGVGSRETPPAVRAVMRACARALGGEGWTLRSGAARGADRAFEEGCDEVGGAKEIYVPWNGFGGRNGEGPQRMVGERGVKVAEAKARAKLEAIAERYWDPVKCPWRRLRSTTRQLMTRNVCQVLGEGGDTPAQAVLYWTPLPEEGGTTQALRIARGHGVACLRIEADTSVAEIVGRVRALAGEGAR